MTVRSVGRYMASDGSAQMLLVPEENEKRQMDASFVHADIHQIRRLLWTTLSCFDKREANSLLTSSRGQIYMGFGA